MKAIRQAMEGLLFIVLAASATALVTKQQKPIVYIIGDSTVRNDDSTGHRGWGSYLAAFLDTAKIAVSNQAMAGRSTRMFNFPEVSSVRQPFSSR